QLAEALFLKEELSADEIIPLLTKENLMHWPHVIKVKSKVLKRNVCFANESGLMETLEGSVKYNKGDAIVEGNKGEKWPVAIEKFKHIYSPESVEFGKDGSYFKNSKDVLAFKFN